jgi:hypothetical protein
MEIGRPPERFSELCEKIGVALMVGQKVQFALAHYFALYQIVNSQWSTTKAKESIEYHLSRPMGVVVSDIEKSAPLEESISLKVKSFKAMRNWLAHDFDQEATPHLSQGNLLPEYIEKMEAIINSSEELMFELDAVGEALAL